MDNRVSVRALQDVLILYHVAVRDEGKVYIPGLYIYAERP